MRIYAHCVYIFAYYMYTFHASSYWIFQLFVKQKTCADNSAQVFAILNFLLILLQEFVQLLEISQNFIVEIQLWDINRAAIILTDAIGQAANFNSVIFRKTTAVFDKIRILYHQ